MSQTPNGSTELPPNKNSASTMVTNSKPDIADPISANPQRTPNKPAKGLHGTNTAGSIKSARKLLADLPSGERAEVIDALLKLKEEILEATVIHSPGPNQDALYNNLRLDPTMNLETKNPNPSAT